MKLLYFAWVRQKIGRGEETIELPREARTVGDLVIWLKGRGEGYADAFADVKRLRAAVPRVRITSTISRPRRSGRLTASSAIARA